MHNSPTSGTNAVKNTPVEVQKFVMEEQEQFSLSWAVEKSTQFRREHTSSSVVGLVQHETGSGEVRRQVTVS